MVTSPSVTGTFEVVGEGQLVFWGGLVLKASLEVVLT